GAGTGGPSRTGASPWAPPRAEPMRSLHGLAEGCLLPGFAGTRAPAWVLRHLEDGLGGAVLFARNVESPEQVAALSAELHGVRADALVAIDEEGGDVT